MTKLTMLLALAACGGSTPAPVVAPTPVTEPSVETAGTTQSDPSAHRFATVVPAGKVPATLWQDGNGNGKLVTTAGSAPDRIAVALTATAKCDGASCTYYEHSVPAGQQRAASLAWQSYGPDRRFAPLWGDAGSGPFAVLVDVKAGSAPFWHMHGRDVRMVVLAGTVEFRESGHPVQSLAPGSYVQQTGGYKHTESCAAGSDCVIYIHGDRGFDVKPM